MSPLPEHGFEPNETSLHHTLRSLSEGVIAADLAGRITLINAAAEKLTGWPANEALGRSLNEVFRLSHPSGEAVEYFRRGRGNSDAAILLTTRSGELLPIEDNTAPIRDDDGSLVGLVSLFRRQNGTQSSPLPMTGPVGESGPPRTDLLESLGDPFFCLDSQWRFTFANGPAATAFGTDRQSLVGRAFWDEVPPSIRQAHYQNFANVLTKRERRTFELHDAEHLVWWEAHVFPFQDGVLVLLQDITARKAAAEEAARQDRLESLGLLARGFVHDFNNLLTVQLGNLSLLNLKIPDDSSARHDLDAARLATEKAQQLVQNLLTFAKGGAPVKKRLRLGPWLEDFFSSWPKLPNVTYRLGVPRETGDLEADPGQLKRVLSSLLRNAEQSIPLGKAGDLLVRGWTRQRAAGQHHDDPVAIIEVIDNGKGIAAEAASRIFEPYFTTKADENASGLGLAVVDSVVKNHHGHVTFRSAPGQTIFTVQLPALATAQPIASAMATIPRPTSAIRVLLLEDESLIRQLVTANLTAHGFKVTSTIDGAETVRLYREALTTGAPFDVVLLDLTIPGGQGGRETIEQLRQLHPGVKAIVSSGYSDDSLMSRYLDFGFRAVLPKPYEPGELVKLVKEIAAG